MRNAFVEKLTELARKDPRIFLITGDLGFGVLTDFAAEFPRQYLNAGVAEQTMTAVAAGMALEGRVVFTYSIANFPTLRCLEQIRNDICYHGANVNVVSIGGGFSYGPLGMSHFATEDLSIMRALPNMTVVVPSEKWQVADAVEALVAHPGPCYLRLDKSDAGRARQPGETFALGKARLVRAGSDLTLVAAGGVLKEALDAAEALAAEGIACRVLDMPTLKPLDAGALAAAAAETGGIVTVEENTVLGGLGGAVAEVCLEQGVRPRQFQRVGLNDEYPEIVGDQLYLRKAYHLDSGAVAAVARRLVAANRAA